MVYQLVENSLDPGWLLFLSLQNEMRRQIDADRSCSLDFALQQLLEMQFGPPRPEEPARALIKFAGDSAHLVPGELTVVNRGAELTARRADPTLDLPLAQLDRIAGTSRSGDLHDLTLPLKDGESHLGPWNGVSLREIEVQLTIPDAAETSYGWVFSGLLWDAPPALTLRVRAANLQGQPLSIKHDHVGRLFLPPQQIAGRRQDQATLHLTLQIEPGELRHAGRFHINVAEFLVHGLEPTREFRAPAAEELTTPFRSLPFDCTLEQPFAGCVGQPGESRDCWRERVTEAARHRGRAVTVDDYIALARECDPEIQVLDVSPTKLVVDGRQQASIRVCIVPRSWRTAYEMLPQALLLAHRLRDFLAGRVPAGLHLLVGPPSVRQDGPGSDSAIWMYRDYVASVPEGTAWAIRSDGVRWPVFTLPELERIVHDCA